jgi:hypothetical protein
MAAAAAEDGLEKAIHTCGGGGDGIVAALADRGCGTRRSADATERVPPAAEDGLERPSTHKPVRNEGP